MSFDTTLFYNALLSGSYAWGALLAIVLGVMVQIVGTLLGLMSALLREANHKLLRGMGLAYVWIFRAAPELVLVILAWNALPQIIPALKSNWYSPFVAALLAFSLHEGAMMTEIIRSGIHSVHPGQKRAAQVLGMRPVQVFLWVSLPQIIKTIIPPTGNRLIIEVKLTSLASVIALEELLTAAQRDVSTYFSYAEFYTAALVYYLVIVSMLMIGQRYVERRYEWVSVGKGYAGDEH